ncbi:MAG: AAA family ATPase [Chloroflexota bacterium]
MTTNRQFSLALNTMVELKQDEPAPLAKPVPATPTLNQSLLEVGALPREALFLGIALDGLPVLLNLHDPIPGPLLVIGDAGVGKTAFLRMLASGVQQTHHPEAVRFGVITNHPEEWEGVETTVHRIGVFPVTQNHAKEFIHSLAGWAHANQKAGQTLLLLIDDLESVAKLEPEVIQDLRWLLLRGPARRVWPVITINAERYGQVLSWIPMFRTRIFGKIAKEHIAVALGGDPLSALDQLEAGIQFTLRENGKWLKFWLPSC